MGVVGPFAGHALTLTSATDATKVRTLPSSGFPRTHRYYDPLGLPLSTLRFRLGLIRRRSPRRRRLRRLSRVQHLSLNACCAPYPAGTRCAFRFLRTRCCLRRDVSGSAPGLFLCRGSRLHFVLRPAFLLPLSRLSTSGFSLRGLPLSCGPATRRSGAYRDGTFTRWRNAASRGRPNVWTSACVSAHHAGEPNSSRSGGQENDGGQYSSSPCVDS